MILAQLVRADRSRAAEAPTAAVARELARHWSDTGLGAHAALNAQAELAAHLLRLDAPAPLLHGAARSLLDETAIAAACLELGQRYGAAEHALPTATKREGALDPERASPDRSELVLSTLRRGCIAATVDSSCAREALEHCQDPGAREVLLQIEHGRARTAQLSWRFLGWVLLSAPGSPAPGSPAPSSLSSGGSSSGGPELADQVRVTVLTALGTQAAPAPLSLRGRQLLRYGVLDGEQRLAIEQRVLREVVLPCMENALARARASRAL